MKPIKYKFAHEIPVKKESERSQMCIHLHSENISLKEMYQKIRRKALKEIRMTSHLTCNIKLFFFFITFLINSYIRNDTNRATGAMNISKTTEIEDGDVDSSLRYYLEKIDDLVSRDVIENGAVTRETILRAQITYITNDGFLAAITTQNARDTANKIFQVDLNKLLQRRYNI